ncbi:hypothetical protein CTEN210_15268 [Chaetoceros tenuissimus]|uniref:Uncharacterized protein n=1 Tax=Chaetoceros tenuissimus TaxID=426638 RepID=A0AAD3D7B7_9STRA|nr:hypothetical protein CTEN210_15268 [Chaetoceros tenuissimus]
MTLHKNEVLLLMSVFVIKSTLAFVSTLDLFTKIQQYKASKDDGNDGQIPEPNFLDQSRDDFDRRPLRIIRDVGAENQKEETEVQQGFEFEQWGVEYIKDPSSRPLCPSSLDEVAEKAFNSITSTLYCKQKFDPNIVTNALAVSVNERRPVGFAFWPKGRDVGRLGIEVDGLRHLLIEPSLKKHSQIRNENDLKMYKLSNKLNKNMAFQKRVAQHVIELEAIALRRFSLILASKLSRGIWDDFEVDIGGKEPKSRPVALFFNTIRQALQATNELQKLKRVAALRGHHGVYDDIRILCLGQDSIPKDMHMLKNRNKDVNGKDRRKWGASKELSDGKIDPKKGLVLIVQPTDYNNDITPPSPSVSTVQHLQELLATASVAYIPAVTISPRLTEQFDGNGIEQSGYQVSSTYGGIEPPKGPTPWILRDFIPPVFSYVGDAISLTRKPPKPSNDDMFNDFGRNEFEMSYLSRVTMMQSVLEEGHPWHLYVVENISSYRLLDGKNKITGREENFHYVASTRPNNGRPPKRAILDILSNWN